MPFNIFNSDVIYYINRYSFYNKTNIKSYSGYEQVVKYQSQFKEIKGNQFLNKVCSFFLKKYAPLNYLRITYSKELLSGLKAIVTGCPIFYLYADKDAFILPLLKRKLNLKRLKLYGTLHWPSEISYEFSFHKFHLATEFNGIITLSSSLQSLNFKNSKVLLHGINFDYWSNDNTNFYENLFLIIGISNRDHKSQVRIINKINDIDPNARFILLVSDPKVRKFYDGIPNLSIIKKRIEDSQLKDLYKRAKAVILFQHYCLASNVILESIAMNIPIITNMNGDITEYLGEKYPLFIDAKNEEFKLLQICKNSSYRLEVVKYLYNLKFKFNWENISKETVKFIVNA